jgi:hypothetical protein
VFSVEPVSPSQYESLIKWENLGIDFWDELRRTQTSRIMVPAEQLDAFKIFLNDENIEFKIIIEDVEK